MAAARPYSGSIRRITAQIGSTMNGSRMCDMPMITPARRPDQGSGSEMTPRSIRNRLMTPVSRRITCQANVRTSRLDQNGSSTAMSEQAGDPARHDRHEVGERVADHEAGRGREDRDPERVRQDPDVGLLLEELGVVREPGVGGLGDAPALIWRSGARKKTTRKIAAGSASSDQRLTPGRAPASAPPRHGLVGSRRRIAGLADQLPFQACQAASISSKLSTRYSSSK